MTRDMELIRTLLLRFEQDDVSIPPGYSEEQVAYHVNQMEMAGLIDAQVIFGARPGDGRIRPRGFLFRQMTPRGHDFVSAIGDEGFWRKVVRHFEEQAVPLTLALAVPYAIALGRKVLGLPEDSPE